MADTKRGRLEARLNRAIGLCSLAHDTVQFSPAHPLSEAIEQLRQAIEWTIGAVDGWAKESEVTP